MSYAREEHIQDVVDPIVRLPSRRGGSEDALKGARIQYRSRVIVYDYFVPLAVSRDSLPTGHAHCRT